MTTLTGRTTALRPRFRDLVAAEWIKFWSLRSTYGSMALILGAAIVFSAYAASADYHNWPTYGAQRRALFNPLRDAFPEQAYVFVMLAAASVGAVAIVGEYSTGLLRTTFAAVPARRSVVAAKLVVVATVMTAVGAIAAVTGFAVSQAILSGRQADTSLGGSGVLRAIAASALLAPLCALVGMGLGVLIRHTAATIVTAVAILLLLPTAFDEDRRWKADVYHALPLAAWERLVEPSALQAFYSPYPATITGSWIVYAAWPLAAVLLGVLVIQRRDL